MTTENEMQRRDSFLTNPSAEKFERAFMIKREAINPEARTVELAFSSETPVDRWYGVEILDHSPASVMLDRLRDGGPVLKDHDPCEHIGVVEKVEIGSDRVGRAIVRFGKGDDAEEVFQDIVDGIRKHVSVGYRIHKVEVSDPESNAPTYRATQWEPYEISMVSIPADMSVGVGRSAEPEPAPQPVVVVQPEKRKSKMSDESIDVVAVEKRATDVAMARVNELLAIGDQYAEHGGKDVASRALREGKDVAWAKDQIMSGIIEKSSANRTAPDLGLTDKETRTFSMMRLIRAMTMAAKGERKAWDGAGFERECSDALVKRYGDSPNGGFFVPYEVQKRDMTVAGTGGYAVANVQQPGSFIELLRAQTVVGRAGARMLSGLKGNIEIPKQTGAGTAYLIGAEDDEITESNMTLGQLALSPKTVGAYMEISRLLQMQSDPSVDMLIMDDLAKVIGLKIDLLALNGNGAGGPVGIINTSGIGSVTATSLDYAKTLEFQTDVAAGNALVPGCVYITTPAKAAIIAQRQRFSSTDTPLWTGNILEGSVLGFRGLTTTQLSDGLLFGDFAQLIMAEWGVLELAVDPTANFKAGITGIRAFQSFDVGVRNAAAFSYGSSVT